MFISVYHRDLLKNHAIGILDLLAESVGRLCSRIMVNIVAIIHKSKKKATQGRLNDQYSFVPMKRCLTTA